jgi:hypothetical protein
MDGNPLCGEWVRKCALLKASWLILWRCPDATGEIDAADSVKSMRGMAVSGRRPGPIGIDTVF